MRERTFRSGLAALLVGMLATSCGAGPPEHVRIGLLAPLAGDLSETWPTLWYRFRPGVNDSLEARRSPNLLHTSASRS